MQVTFRHRILIFVGILSVVVLRTIFYNSFERHIDEITLILLAIGLIVLLIPFEKISSFKAGNVELVLERKEVQSSIASLQLEEFEQQKIKSVLKVNEASLKYLTNSKILWIDDKQGKIIAEKRLLRNLGVHIVPAISSDMAMGLIEGDGDFDLIISDIQRKGEYFQYNEGTAVHDGVNFMEYLLRNNLISEDIPVLFYAAYPHKKLVQFTNRVIILREKVKAVNNISNLIDETVRFVAIKKTTKTKVLEKKRPTKL